jgi:putative transposase
MEKKDKKTTTIITRRIKISPVGDKEERERVWDMLRYWDNSVYRMSNDIINQQNLNLLLSDRIIGKSEDGSTFNNLKLHLEELQNEYFNDKPNRKETLIEIKLVYDGIRDLRSKYKQTIRDTFGHSIQHTSYDFITKKYPEIPSGIKGSLNQTIFKVFNNDLKDVISGKRSIPFVSDRFLYLKQESKDFTFTLMKINFKTYLGRDRSNNKIILQKIVNGEYIICDSSIQIKDKDIYLNLVINLPIEKLELDENIIVGADMGLNVPIYAACSDDIRKMSIGSREEFLNQRSYIQKRKRELQKAAQYNVGGRGRTHKLKSLEKIKLRERNHVKNLNHKYSSMLINFAKKCNAKYIYMEDLKGICDDEKRKWILRNWSYFELQNMVIQKAKKYGIIVVMVDPAYTSQTCSCCGNIDKTQRVKILFVCNNIKCKDFGVEKHADYNGALNICKSKPKKVKESLELV